MLEKTFNQINSDSIFPNNYLEHTYIYYYVIFLIYILILGTCPEDFYKSESLSSCYRVFSENHLAGTVEEARSHCKSLHPLSDLVSIETQEEKNEVAKLLTNRPSKF